jgi:hypothetical protein
MLHVSFDVQQPSFFPHGEEHKGNAEQVPSAHAGSFSAMRRQMALDVALLRLRTIFLA